MRHRFAPGLAPGLALLVAAGAAGALDRDAPGDRRGARPERHWNRQHRGRGRTR